jgi:hypothetical protein
MRSAATFLTAALFVAVLAGDAQARRSGWVPQPAWDAVKARARADLKSGVRTPQVTLYKSRWSRRVSRGLRSSAGGDAYIVHARRRGNGGQKTKGTYLVEKSSQGRYEAFPLAPNKKGRHVSTVRWGRDASIRASADGLFPANKVAHGVRVTRARGRSVKTRVGTTVARKDSRGTSTLFVVGDLMGYGGAMAHVENQGPSAPAHKGVKVSFEPRHSFVGWPSSHRRAWLPE